VGDGRDCTRGGGEKQGGWSLSGRELDKEREKVEKQGMTELGNKGGPASQI